MRKIIFILVCLFTLTCAEGQITGAYTFGGIVQEGIYNTSFSGPLSFIGETDCLTLKNGISVLMQSDNAMGVFKMNCLSTVLDDAMHITIYPNPAQLYTIIQSNQFALATDVVDIIMMDVKGNITYHGTARGLVLKSGLKINTGHLAGGLYLLKISASHKTQSFKIIKTGTLP
jgi:hypothetical protein